LHPGVDSEISIYHSSGLRRTLFYELVNSRILPAEK
jgi:hypothetical protein